MREGQNHSPTCVSSLTELFDTVHCDVTVHLLDSVGSDPEDFSPVATIVGEHFSGRLAEIGVGSEDPIHMSSGHLHPPPANIGGKIAAETAQVAGDGLRQNYHHARYATGKQIIHKVSLTI
jgi:hypothetical protein